MAIVLFVLAVLLIPLPASAALLFDWTGTCRTGCTGQATFHIATIDTFPTGVHTGPPGPSWLLEATYQDSVHTIGFLAQTWNRSGNDLLLPASGPGPSVISADGFGFSSKADGSWRVDAEVPPPCETCTFAYIASGTGSVWVEGPAAAVPWPATGLLVLGGLTVLPRRCAPRF